MNKKVKILIAGVIILFIMFGVWSRVFKDETVDEIENGMYVESPEESVWEIEDAGVLISVDDVYRENSYLVFETTIEDLEKRDISSEYRILGPWKLIDAQENEYWSSLTEVENVINEKGELLSHKRRISVVYRDFEGQDTGLTLFARIQPTYMLPSEDGTITIVDTYFEDIPAQTKTPYYRNISDFSLAVETERSDSADLVVSVRIEGGRELLESIIEQVRLEIRDNLGRTYTSNEATSKMLDDDMVIKDYSFSELPDDATSISFFYVLRTRASRPGPIRFTFSGLHL